MDSQMARSVLATLTTVNLIANVVQLLSALCCRGVFRHAVCHWGQAQIWLNSKMNPVSQISGQKWTEMKTIQSMSRFRGVLFESVHKTKKIFNDPNPMIFIVFILSYLIESQEQSAGA